MPDESGQPVDVILQAVRRERQSLRIEQQEGAHPADDNNLWFFSNGSAADVARQEAVEVQIGTYPGGSPPYLIESTGHDERVTTDDAQEAVEVILTWLGHN